MITKGNHTEQKTHHTLEFLRMIGARYGGKFDRDTIETEITGIAINCGAGRKLTPTLMLWVSVTGTFLPLNSETCASAFTVNSAI